jgi:hypothetical protein
MHEVLVIALTLVGGAIATSILLFGLLDLFPRLMPSVLGFTMAEAVSVIAGCVIGVVIKWPFTCILVGYGLPLFFQLLCGIGTTIRKVPRQPA